MPAAESSSSGPTIPSRYERTVASSQAGPPAPVPAAGCPSTDGSPTRSNASSTPRTSADRGADHQRRRQRTRTVLSHRMAADQKLVAHISTLMIVRACYPGWPERVTSATVKLLHSFERGRANGAFLPWTTISASTSRRPTTASAFAVRPIKRQGFHRPDREDPAGKCAGPLIHALFLLYWLAAAMPRRISALAARPTLVRDQLYKKVTVVCWTCSMQDIPEEFDGLQALLDASAAAGTHLRNAVTEQRRLDASYSPPYRWERSRSSCRSNSLIRRSAPVRRSAG